MVQYFCSDLVMVTSVGLIFPYTTSFHSVINTTTSACSVKLNDRDFHFISFIRRYILSSVYFEKFLYISESRFQLFLGLTKRCIIFSQNFRSFRFNIHRHFVHSFNHSNMTNVMCVLCSGIFVNVY